MPNNPTNEPAAATATLPQGGPTAVETASGFYAEAERLLLRLAREERDVPSPSEGRVFDILGWDKRRVEGEMSRARQFLRWRQVSGTPDDRRAARAKLEQAQNQLAQNAPALRKELERVEREVGGKLRALEAQVDDAQEDVTRREGASRHLHKALPQHLLVEFHRRLAEVKRETRNEQWQKKGRRQGVLRAAIALLDSDEFQSVTPPKHLSAQIQAVMQNVEAAGFSLSTLRQQRPAIEAELSEVEEFLAAADAKTEAARLGILDELVETYAHVWSDDA